MQIKMTNKYKRLLISIFKAYQGNVLNNIALLIYKYCKYILKLYINKIKYYE